MRVAGNRELPPRFQRKQQQQQKDVHFSGELGPHTDSGYGVGPSPSGSMLVPMHGGAPFQQQSGTYSPMMPPMMIARNPGGSPVMAGKAAVATPAGGEDVSLRPVRNFAPLLKPNTPATLPRSAQSSSTTRAQVCVARIHVSFFFSVGRYTASSL